MTLQRIAALTRKEWLHITRDWRSLVMAICAPMLLVGLFGYALKLDVENIPLIIWDQSKSSASRELISQFSITPHFDVIDQSTQSYGEINHAIDSRSAFGVLVIPEDFHQHTLRGERTDVQLIADGSDANTATIALGYAEAILQNYWNRHLMTHPTLTGKFRRAIIEPVTHIWYNPNLDSHYTIIPGLIAVIMMVISTLMTALAVAREWEQKTMYQLLSTPMQPLEFILGKLMPYFTLAMLDVVLIMLIGVYLFGVPIRGNIILVLFVAAIFCTGSLCLGLLISGFAKNQMLATQLAMLSTFIPSFLLSGFFTPIASMPYPIQLITYLVPARYFVTALRGIFLKGVGLEVLYPEVAILTLFTIVLLLLTLQTLKTKQTA